MLLVFFNCFTKHKDVIQVNMDKYSDVVSEYRVHQLLKGRWYVTVALLHDKALVDALDRREGGFPNILWLHLDLFICVREIYF